MTFKYTAQMDLDWWGHWFFNCCIPPHYSEQDVIDMEMAYMMGSEL